MPRIGIANNRDNFFYFSYDQGDSVAETTFTTRLIYKKNTLSDIQENK